MCVRDCILLIITAYLVGGIPFGVLLAQVFHLPDPRKIGSGNIGATNMARSGHTGVALLTLLLDALKGAAAVWMSFIFFHATPLMSAVALMAATTGHIYSPWLKFRGGKGVATTLGGMLALYPVIGAMLVVIWLLVFVCTGISSLSSIAALLFLPLIAWWVFPPLFVLVLAMTSAIALFKHLANIQRLVKGEEPSFFAKKETKA